MSYTMEFTRQTPDYNCLPTTSTLTLPSMYRIREKELATLLISYCTSKAMKSYPNEILDCNDDMAIAKACTAVSGY
jgi:hypothetical protein